MVPAGRDALKAHALRRQHVEDDGEDRHQDDADPVVRQADADDRGCGEQLVEPAAVIVRSQRAEHDAEQEAYTAAGKASTRVLPSAPNNSSATGRLVKKEM